MRVTRSSRSNGAAALRACSIVAYDCQAAGMLQAEPLRTPTINLNIERGPFALCCARSRSDAVFRSCSRFEGRQVQSPDGRFPDALPVSLLLLARRLSCRSRSFVHEDRFRSGERGETIQTF